VRPAAGPKEGIDAMRVNPVMSKARRWSPALLGLLLLAFLALLLAGWPSPRARAQDPNTPPGSDASWSEDSTATGGAARSGNTFVAEIIDTVYVVDAAQFFALDLPTHTEGALADHLSGTITMAEKKGDIIVRIFRTADYQGWLKKRDLEHTSPLWSSKKARTINVDMELPAGVPITLLLDNGYSIRTSKKVHCQLQMQYVLTGAAPRAAAPSSAPKPPVDDLVSPRSNTEEYTPPAPPPPDTTSQ
jgi:hypothetical protein